MLKTKGFSLLEIIIALAILGVIATLVINPFTSFRDHQVLNGAVEEILASLQQARVKTLSSEGGNQYGIHFASNQVVLFAGTTYDPVNPSNQDIGLSSSVTISGISLAGGSSDIVFQKLTGVTNQSGTVTIELNSDPTLVKTVTINSNGISDVN